MTAEVTATVAPVQCPAARRSLTVLVPALNEAANLGPTVETLVRAHAAVTAPLPVATSTVIAEFEEWESPVGDQALPMRVSTPPAAPNGRSSKRSGSMSTGSAVSTGSRSNAG